MKNPYAQVALTYVRRPFSTPVGWLLSFAAVAMLAPALVAFLLEGPSPGGMAHWLWVLVTPFFYIFGFVAVHVKESFCTPLSQALPGYRRVHITVAGCVVLLITVVMPMVMALMVGVSPIGLSAILVLLFGVFFWGIISQPLLLFSLALVPFLIACSLSSWALGFQSFLKLFLSGQLDALAVGVFVAGAIIIVHCGRLLWRLNEDMPGYHRRMRFDWTANSQRTSQVPMEKGMSLPGSEARLERKIARKIWHVHHASTSWRSRLCRWPLGVASWHETVLWAVMALLYVEIFEYFFDRSTMPMLICMLLILVGLRPTGQMLEHLRVLEYELALPIDRVSYLRQLCLMIWLDWFQFWGGLALVLGLWWMQATWGDGRSILTILAVITLTGCCEMAMFGLILWTSRYRSKALMTFVPMLICMMGPALASGFIGGPQCKGILADHCMLWFCIAGGIALVGIVAAWDGYRRWLKTDLA
jgi:hypothetical protein